jgi:hypothetical protein
MGKTKKSTMSHKSKMDEQEGGEASRNKNKKVSSEDDTNTDTDTR